MRRLFPLSILALSACSEPATALVVATSTDAAVPADLSHLRVRVERGGASRHDRTYALPGDAPMPGTLSIAREEPGGGPVTITLDGLDASGVRVTRRARVTFVEGSTRLLRLRLTYSCFDVPCDAEHSCVDGVCQGVDVDGATLDEATSPGPTSPAGCFDEAACLAGATPVPLACELAAPGPAGSFNLAAKWAGSGAAALVPAAAYSVAGGRVSLSPQLCSQVKTGRVTALFASSSCPTATTEPCPRDTSLPAPGAGGRGGAAAAAGMSGSGGSSGMSGSGGVAGMSGSGGSSGKAGSGGAAGMSGSGGVAGMSGAGGVAGLSGSGGVAGVSGAGGSSGKAASGGVAGAGGAAGMSGSGGAAGVSGSGGIAGMSGSSGSGGDAGAAGSAGAVAVDATPRDLAMSRAAGCGLSGGAAYCWGYNSGVLGTAETGETVLAPAKVLNAPDMVQLAAGRSHLCGLTSAGGVHCWGLNDGAQCSADAGDLSSRVTATPVAPLSSGVDELTISAQTTCVRRGGLVSCFGHDEKGTLGSGPQSGPRGLTDVPGVTDALALSASTDASLVCAIRPGPSAGTRVTCWGEGLAGPADVPGLADAVEVAITSAGWVVARTASGAVLSTSVSAGALSAPQPVPVPTSTRIAAQEDVVSVNATGEVVRARSTDEAPHAQSYAAVPGLPVGDPVVSVSTGSTYLYGLASTCARTASGERFCWGDDIACQLGTGCPEDEVTPFAVPGIGPVQSVTAGAFSTAIVDMASKVRFWGAPRAFGKAPGSSEWTATPVDVTGFVGAPSRVSLGVEDETAHVLLQGGGAVRFRYGAPETTGELLGAPDAGKLSSVMAASVYQAGVVPGGLAFFSRDTPDTVFSYGVYGNGGVAPGGAYLSLPFAGISAHVTYELQGYNPSHHCVIAGGALSCWGPNKSGQTGDESAADTTTTPHAVTLPRPVVSACAGWKHTCALDDMGDVHCFGYAGAGQTGTVSSPKGVPQKVAVSGQIGVVCGEQHTCSWSPTDVHCWGHNLRGELGAGDRTGGPIPRKVALSGVSAMSAGDTHTCALTPAGVSCWGGGYAMKLGNGKSGFYAAATPLVLP